MLETNNYFSINQINEIIHECFSNQPFFKNIILKGQITNFKGPNRNGHLYFSLKDEKSQISAVIFKFDYFSIKDEFKNGDEVYVKGEISTYTPSGTYQIIIKELELVGKGKLLLKREELKNKLLKEGIFDESNKKDIPKYPTKIVVITGKNSAAAEDFRFNLLRRWPIAKLIFLNCLVQGEKAPQEIINSLDEALKFNPDLIILGRGGGSEDDLIAFDDENLVRFIHNNVNIPLISAIGHEINSTFVDFVADEHASTPTGACEIAVPDINNVLDDLNRTQEVLKERAKNKIRDYENSILRIKNLFSKDNFIKNLDLKLLNYEHLSNELKNNILNKIDKLHNELLHKSQILNELNPNNLLKKGYAIIKKNNSVISDSSSIKVEDDIDIIFKNSTIKAKVKEIDYE